ncbi:MAG: radical SAM protein [Acidobacteria bacterium]|nr:MAG: radical SAM protein [Acidobacteriota bacterium]
MKKRAPRHVFGPVPSRRLGRSLGIDVVPFKTCSYDCIYCQLGRTTCKTVTLSEYVPVDDVLSEVDSQLAAGTVPDYITFSGSGEPTLHSKLAVLIDGIKRITQIPIAVLTNGSLLWREDVREALSRADLVVPSLDAGDDRLFQYVNRPHPSLCFEQIVAGIQHFRAGFKNQLWLEVFLLGGVTTVTADLQKIRNIVEQIRPDRVQLNTVARPPSEPYAHPVSLALLESCADFLGDRTEIITGDQAWTGAGRSPRADEIVELLRRRPCTAEQIAHGIDAHPAEVVKRLELMLKTGRVSITRMKDRSFYTVAGNQP